MKSNVSIRRGVRWLLTASALALLAPQASATEGLGRTILEVTIEGNNYARLSVSGAAIGGRPSCHVTSSGYTVHYAWDVSTNKGKALLSVAQAALLAGRKVNVVGSGSCTDTGVTRLETLTILTIWAN